MSLLELDKLLEGLPAYQRRELLEYARRRNAQAIRYATIVVGFWLAISTAMFLLWIFDRR